MLAGGFYFCQVFRRFGRQVFLLAGQHGVADDGVHGRADVVAHVGKERALGPGALLCRYPHPFRRPFPGQDEPEDQEQDHHDNKHHAEHHQHLCIQRALQLACNDPGMKIAGFLPLFVIDGHIQGAQQVGVM